MGQGFPVLGDGSPRAGERTGRCKVGALTCNTQYRGRGGSCALFSSSRDDDLYSIVLERFQHGFLGQSIFFRGEGLGARDEVSGQRGREAEGNRPQRHEGAKKEKVLRAIGDGGCVWEEKTGKEGRMDWTPNETRSLLASIVI